MPSPPEIAYRGPTQVHRSFTTTGCWLVLGSRSLSATSTSSGTHIRGRNGPRYQDRTFLLWMQNHRRQKRTSNTRMSGGREASLRREYSNSTWYSTRDCLCVDRPSSRGECEYAKKLNNGINKVNGGGMKKGVNDLCVENADERRYL